MPLNKETNHNLADYSSTIADVSINLKNIAQLAGSEEYVAERISNYCLVQEYFDCFGPELIFSTNEDISCHSARVTSLGNYKKVR